MTTHPDYGSPLSRLVEDDNLTIVENIIPHCSPSVGRFLAVGLKLMEIQKIMAGFNDSDRLLACGFEENTQDMESVLRSIRSCVSAEKAQQIDQILGILRFSKFYEKYNQILAEHPELAGSMRAAGTSGNPEASENGSFDGNDSPGGNPFSDPSLFFLLNTLMNSSADGMNDSRIKQVLEFARNTGGENKDMSGLVSALLKKQ